MEPEARPFQRPVSLMLRCFPGPLLPRGESALRGARDGLVELPAQGRVLVVAPGPGGGREPLAPELGAPAPRLVASPEGRDQGRDVLRADAVADAVVEPLPEEAGELHRPRRQRGVRIRDGWRSRR